MKKIYLILLCYAFLANSIFTSCSEDSSDPLSDDESSKVEKNENQNNEKEDTPPTKVEYQKLWAPVETDKMIGVMFMDISDADALSCYIGLYNGSAILSAINIENPLYTQEAFGSTRVTIKGTVTVKSQNRVVEKLSGYFYTTKATQVYYSITTEFGSKFLQYLTEDPKTSVTLTLEAPLGNQTLNFVPQIK